MSLVGLPSGPAIKKQAYVNPKAVVAVQPRLRSGFGEDNPLIQVDILLKNGTTVVLTLRENDVYNQVIHPLNQRV